MITAWETQEQRLRRFMKIPPKKKLEWLHELHQCILSATTPQGKKLRQKLRASRSVSFSRYKPPSF